MQKKILKNKNKKKYFKKSGAKKFWRNFKKK